MQKDKLGPYIERLMGTVLDKEQDDFVRDLAWSELGRLKVNIDEFLLTHNRDDDGERQAKTIKTLLQEEKDNGTD
tara:strand:- start:960 stop:1184 length:225 start_codon:yes stop_codon:yes gene_type:complete